MLKSIVRIATRKSPLAIWQANHIAYQLKQCWPSIQIELVSMKTSGDRFLNDKLQSVGGKGLFVKELEEALLAGKADFAVHSMKDVPAELPEGLILGAICKRDNPFDALISRNHINFASLPSGSIIGTASLRRQSQLLAMRPDFNIKPLRGNIHTRLSKFEAGEFDAIILAAAGLERMAMQPFISQQLNEEIMLPACGQGALGIECRHDDQEILDLIKPLNDELSATCVGVERRVNARLGGNCQVPLAVYCHSPIPNQLTLRAKILTPDGATMLVSQGTKNICQPLLLADACADDLIRQGAANILGLSL